jgi:hypothetical protein
VYEFDDETKVEHNYLSGAVFRRQAIVFFRHIKENADNFTFLWV